MDKIWGFIVFEHFVSMYVLVPFYYIGAIAIPFACWVVLTKVRHKYGMVDRTGGNGHRTEVGTGKRYAIISLFIVFFVFMEIIWRIFFEYLIAYLQIHHVLLHMRVP